MASVFPFFVIGGMGVFMLMLGALSIEDAFRHRR